MALTWVLVVACMAFGVNGYGIQVDQPVCDGQQLACTYCLDTVTFLKSTVDDIDTGNAIMQFMLVICDFMNSSTPAHKACTEHCESFPMRMRILADLLMARPEELCGFVCVSRGRPLSEKCIKKPVTSEVALNTSDSMACEVCKSVPLLAQQVLTSKGFLDAVVKFLLINCDLLPTGPAQVNCIEHTKNISLKIQLFAAKMNPDTGCKFICDI
ncbi:uncharacterized protein LOC117301524 [Asterias rubens]|uniref:uncharacterized protein LOC117301524 n=1 Tax=Asterias rubens TaxID=7604 RepID=UPI001455B776|nr:uncharacterized protein LOC117301524 [Asterias rubens]